MVVSNFIFSVFNGSKAIVVRTDNVRPLQSLHWYFVDLPIAVNSRKKFSAFTNNILASRFIPASPHLDCKLISAWPSTVSLMRHFKISSASPFLSIFLDNLECKLCRTYPPRYSSASISLAEITGGDTGFNVLAFLSL